MRPLSISCELGHISQDPNGNVTFTPGERSDANGYEVTISNKNPSLTATLSQLGIGFYDGSGAQIGSDTPVGSKTMASGNVPVAPAHSLSVIFYGPDSGVSAIRNPAPRNWVSDRHMPAGATRCGVLSSTVYWPT